MCYRMCLNLRHYALLVSIAAISFTSCKKSSSTNTQYEQLGTTNASSVSQLENISSDVESMSDLSAVLSFGNTGFFGNGNINLEKDFDDHHWHHNGDHNGDDGDDFSHCAIISFNTILNSRVLTINFGTTNCTGADGTNRRGQIIITFTDNFFDSGGSRTITFNSYYINDNLLTGSKTITNMGMDVMGHPVYAIDVNDTLWLGNNNGYISWTGHRTRTWVQGYNTYRRDDDIFLISGASTIHQADGSILHVAINMPLQISHACKWIEAGSITFTDQNNKVEIIDYGSGNCDSEAQLTVDGHTYNITLH